MTLENIHTPIAERKYPKASQIPDEVLQYAELLKTLGTYQRHLSVLHYNQSQPTEDTEEPINPFITQPESIENEQVISTERNIGQIKHQITQIDTKIRQEGQGRWMQLVSKYRKYSKLRASLPESSHDEESKKEIIKKQLSLLTQDEEEILEEHKVRLESYSKEGLIELIRNDVDESSQNYTFIQALRRLQSLAQSIANLQTRLGTYEQHQQNYIALKGASGVVKDAVSRDRQQNKQEIHSQMQDLRADYDLEILLRIQTLRQHSRDIHSGRLPQTPSIQDATKQIIFIAQELGMPVLLKGETGTGKTSILIQIAKDNLNAGDTVYLISGHKDLDTIDVLGKTSLDATSGNTETKYKLGPLYKAIKEGRPIIIDEINAIPHETLIVINHVLTAKPGDTISLQGNEDGGSIIVKEGFIVLASGNFGNKYNDLRQPMDIAMLDRFISMDYGYLPQYYPQRDDDTNIQLKNASEDNELFTNMLAYLMRNGVYSDTYDPVKSEWTLEIKDLLWSCAMATKHLQDKAEGKSDNETNAEAMPQAPSMRTIFLKVLQAFTSPRYEPKIQSHRLRFEKALYELYIKQIEGPASQSYAFHKFADYNLFNGWSTDDVDTDFSDIGVIFTAKPPTDIGVTQEIGIVPEYMLAQMYAGKLPEYTNTLSQSEEPLSPVEELKLKEGKEEIRKKIAQLQNTEGKSPEQEELDKEALEKLEKILGTLDIPRNINKIIFTPK